MLRRYERFTDGSQYDVLYSTLFRLAFADSTARRSALAGLDTLPVARARQAVVLLRHPRFLEAQAAVVRSLERRPDAPAALLSEWQKQGLAHRGRLREALAAMEMAEDANPYGMLSLLYLAGVPLADETVDRMLTLGPTDSFPSPKHWFATLRSVEAGDWSQVEALGQRARQSIAAMRAAGDSTSAQRIEASMEVVEGRAAMVRGNEEEALRRLETAFRAGAAPPFVLAWIMELHAAAGRPEEALRYGRVMAPDPWMGLAMGRLYEAVEDREAAIDAYSWVTLAWERADPELQPRVAEARQAIARLRGLQLG